MDKNLLNKLPEETEEQYLWRMGHYIGDGLVSSWKEIGDIVNSQLCDDENKWKDCDTFRRQISTAKRYYDNVFSKIDKEYEYYKGVIAFRKAHEGLRFATTEEVCEHLHFVDDLPKNVVAFTIKTDEETLFVVYNANKEAVTIDLPETAEWQICIDNDKASAEGLRTLTAEDKTVEVQPVACLAAVLK